MLVLSSLKENNGDCWGTGAGKSTLVKLLLRINEVTAGTISYSGTDIRSLSQQTIRKVISYVPQKPFFSVGQSYQTY